MRISDWSSDVCSSDLNAGGFARNQRMLDQYMPGVKSEWTSVIEEDLGEMIEAGQRIGAAVAQMDRRIGMQITLPPDAKRVKPNLRSEEHTSELQSLMRISYAVFCLKKKKNKS